MSFPSGPMRGAAPRRRPRSGMYLQSSPVIANQCAHWCGNPSPLVCSEIGERIATSAVGLLAMTAVSYGRVEICGTGRCGHRPLRNAKPSPLGKVAFAKQMTDEGQQSQTAKRQQKPGSSPTSQRERFHKEGAGRPLPLAVSRRGVSKGEREIRNPSPLWLLFPPFLSTQKGGRRRQREAITNFKKSPGESVKSPKIPLPSQPGKGETINPDFPHSVFSKTHQLEPQADYSRFFSASPLPFSAADAHLQEAANSLALYPSWYHLGTILYHFYTTIKTAQ